MEKEYNDYNAEKALHYTKQIIQFARRRWGDVPLTPKTHTWSDGTVSILVEHRMHSKEYPDSSLTFTLNFQETGFTETDCKIRETVERIGPDGNIIHEEHFPVEEMKLFRQYQ